MRINVYFKTVWHKDQFYTSPWTYEIGVGFIRREAVAKKNFSRPQQWTTVPSYSLFIYLFVARITFALDFGSMKIHVK